jgi:citrate lyase beta subunit
MLPMARWPVTANGTSPAAAAPVGFHTALAPFNCTLKNVSDTVIASYTPFYPYWAGNCNSSTVLLVLGDDAVVSVFAATGLSVPPDPAALTWPAHQVLTCAHAYGLACWGLAGSIAVVDDVEGFEQTVRAGRAMGFTGSVCIHPKQVPIVNRGFSPTADERAWAARVVAADEAARAAGLGAVLLDGRMIDRPIVERARRWLDFPA